MAGLIDKIKSIYVLDGKLRKIEEKKEKLKGVERILDAITIPAYLSSSAFDSIMTYLYIADVQYEQNVFTRTMMEKFGKGEGLILDYFLWTGIFFGVLYGSYKIIDTIIKKWSRTEIPILRKIAPYVLLVMVSYEHIRGGLGWLY